MSDESRPLLRVVRGNPDDTELAVLTAVVSALAAAPVSTDEPVARSRWGAPQLRQQLRPGPGAWQFSGR
ncbi:acyl-CoA carboxylase subunit epsilon [Kutzneria sp. CA-103260]|uniref:acyl-CoA carboxylase subunit epsilon n=1 Tax=Kutzneria sp. CA-103260 TaxID=2802641 RepID=UPI001BA8010F|nr:acyl-CoA carboxylase subunit epsilon [Kutzneria sp. CA-103260]QUQ70888.1 acetyl/propionyl-CoA carboxylase, subunit epsilon [Kutzneria sp. CA-103260]